ncbi:carboxypeptidase-like regulatory domain-containing protein [Taibaiella koreensis]|uniref:carboxypeptidase-like regulatory domain-containing protein n=1 Tax=Taibaiella koreensis TaxID=1268548 RepID=UPI000E59CD28|nr:carboxypeptidase-like regulatory domain-containing protein [Taibaiella koreensis]
MSYIRHICACVLFVAFLSPVYAQTIQGIVKDTTNTALASISVYIMDGSQMVSYTVSNESGAFTFRNIPHIAGRQYRIEASSVGYTKMSIPLLPDKHDYLLILRPNTTALKTVTIKDDRPKLKVRGDTLSYKVADFSAKGDRVIGDVIRKLPGIEMSKEGKIFYNGKAISNLFIDGDDVLDDKYNIATRSIPNGVVDRVQVLQNNQPIKMLRNKVVSRNTALNLTIKDSAKVNIVGQETVGGGLPGNYYADLNALLLKKKFKAIDNLKANNTSYDLQSDIISHNYLDYLNQTFNSKPHNLLSLGTIQKPELPLERYLFNRSAIINLNNLVNLSPTRQIKANVYYLRDFQRQEYSSSKEIYLPGDTIHYTEKQSNRLRPDIMHAQVTFLDNRDKSYIKNDLILNTTLNSNYSNLLSNGAGLSQKYYDNVYDFSNEFNLMTTLKSKQVIEFYSFINSYKEPEKRIIEPGIAPAIFNSNIPYASITQQTEIPTFSQNAYVSVRFLEGTIKQSYKAGYYLQSQRLKSTLFGTQVDGQQLPAIDSSINNLMWTKSKVYFEGMYDYIGDRIQVNLKVPLNYQSVAYSDKGFSFSNTVNRLFVAPDLYLKVASGNENNFTLNYSYKNEFGTVEDNYRGLVLTDYRSLQANNANLNEQKIHNANVAFNFRRAVKLLFVTVSANFKHTNANSIFNSILTNTFSRTVTLPYNNATNEYFFNGRISKYIYGLRSTVSSTLSYQILQTNLFQNNNLLPYVTTIPSVSFNTDTKISERLNFTYKGAYNNINSKLKTDASKTRINIFQQSATLEYIPATNIYLALSDDYRHASQRGGSNVNYNFVDASIRYQISGSKLDLELSGANIFNVKSYNVLMLSSNSFTSSTYQLPGRIILLTATFNL